MYFCFYPNHEYACPNVSHCPHLGGAALGTVVDAASEQEDFRDMLLGQLDFERTRNAKLFEENEQLKAQIEQLKLELKVERPIAAKFGWILSNVCVIKQLWQRLS
jgi:transposase